MDPDSTRPGSPRADARGPTPRVPERGLRRHRLRGRGGVRGFTLLELLIVLVIGGILAVVVIQSFSRVQGRMGARAAQSNVMGLHAQARAYAVERGQLVGFVVDAGADEVRVELGCAGSGQVLSRLNLAAEFAVDVQAPGNPLILCFTPRGIADPARGTVATATNIRLVRGDRESGVQLLPLGQARSQ